MKLKKAFALWSLAEWNTSYLRKMARGSSDLRPSGSWRGSFPCSSVARGSSVPCVSSCFAFSAAVATPLPFAWLGERRAACIATARRRHTALVEKLARISSINKQWRGRTVTELHATRSRIHDACELLNTCFHSPCIVRS